MTSPINYVDPTGHTQESSSGTGGLLITDVTNLSSDTTKKQLLYAISYKAVDDEIKDYVNSLISLGKEQGNYDFVTINSLYINNIVEGLEGTPRQAAAEHESTMKEAIDDLSSGGTFFLASAAAGALAGGPIGVVVGGTIGVAGLAIGYVMDANQTGASMAGVHYNFDIDIYLNQTTTSEIGGETYISGHVTSLNVAGQFGGYSEY